MGFEFKTFETKKELNREDKKNLEHLWSQIVLGSEENPAENVESMDDKEIKQWIYRSLMQQVDAIEPELGFNANAELIQTIANEQESEEKAKLQLEYIRACNEQFREAAKRQEPGHETRWDTMPSTMREHKTFNCVGASLIGHDLFKKCEIENFFGHPSGHVVNVARLENGEWWYVDFRNDFIHKIKPEVTEIGKVKTMKISNPLNVYDYVPMLEGIEMPMFILGNLSVLRREATDENMPEGFPGLESARELYGRFKNEFDGIKTGKFIDFLYPEAGSISRNPMMQAEGERVEKLRGLFKDFFRSTCSLFSKEVWESVIEEIKQKREIARQFIEQNTDSTEMSDDMRKVLVLYKERLNELKQKDPEAYDKFAESIISVLILREE